MQWFLQHSDPSLLINKHPAFSEGARNTTQKIFLKTHKQVLEWESQGEVSLNGEETKDEVFRAYEVPEDVKEGCFAVSAIDGGTPKRFVVGLAYLNHPEFVKLLAKAEEEFGFEQPGALAVPCLASDLQSILADS
ncbi:hypothetical protein MRB53_032184 [Persea americana]|uniref:Uncharacterized protein n=1 Tax=Persea americana TaxID=3435 RepID=A0ACC2KRN2_PERAE|nr:hypothetical protein MRB53_032184 [Persea americana]